MPVRSLSFFLLWFFISACNGQNARPDFVDANGTPALNNPDDPSAIFQGPDRNQQWVSPWNVFERKLIPRNGPGPQDQISQYIRRIFQDKNGDLWFGTNDDGVCIYHPADYGIRYLTVKEGLAGNTVRGILQDPSGKIWLATNGGLSCFNPSKGCFSPKAFTNYTTKEGLPDNDIWSLLQDSKGTIWIGTMGGLCRLSPSDPAKRIETVLLPEPSCKVSSRFTPSLVWSMSEDHNGNLWLGTDGAGVYRYDGKEFTGFTTKDGLPDNNVSSVLCSSNGKIWLGTRSGGVSCYESNRFSTFNTGNGLGNNYVWTLMEDKKGNVWMGSAGGGVTCYDGKTFSTYAEKSGLTRNHVQSLLEDKNGNIWFGFSGGVFRFEAAEMKEGKRIFRNFIRPGC